LGARGSGCPRRARRYGHGPHPHRHDRLLTTSAAVRTPRGRSRLQGRSPRCDAVRSVQRGQIDLRDLLVLLGAGLLRPLPIGPITVPSVPMSGSPPPNSGRWSARPAPQSRCGRQRGRGLERRQGDARPRGPVEHAPAALNASRRRVRSAGCSAPRCGGRAPGPRRRTVAVVRRTPRSARRSVRW
jgi:hypothetical protein